MEGLMVNQEPISIVEKDPPIDEKVPLMDTKDPLIDEKGALIEQKDPLLDEKGALIDQKDPLIEQKDPLIDEKEPLIDQKDPLIEQKHPLIEQKDPLLDEKEPLIEPKDPLLDEKEPLIDQKDPLIEQKDPLLDEKDPLIDQKDPLIDEKDPLFEQKDPLIDEKDHPSEQKDPLIEEKDPLIDQKDPLIDKNDPLIVDPPSGEMHQPEVNDREETRIDDSTSGDGEIPQPEVNDREGSPIVVPLSGDGEMHQPDVSDREEPAASQNEDENIQDFIGFTLEDQCELIPIVENTSLGLFEIVQEAEVEYLKYLTEIFLRSEYPVEISSEYFEENQSGGRFDPKIILEQVLFGKGKDAQVYFTGIHKSRPNLVKGKRKYDVFLEDADDEDDGPPKMRPVSQKRGRMDPIGSKKFRSAREPIREPQRKVLSGNTNDGGLFGIAALSDLFAGIEEADAAREREDYNHMMNLMAAQENMFEALDPMNSVDSLIDEGGKPGKTPILPCSIRCPGMTGDIPTLQCTRCLCLYHPQCLGYSDDMDFTNFLCSNCDGNASSSDELEAPKKVAILDLMEKLMDLRKGRPAKSPGFQQLGKSGVSLKRLDTNKGFPPLNRSHRLLPLGKNVPRIPIPQLTARNVMITPLPRPMKGQLPRVPTLNPINVPKVKPQRPTPNQPPTSGLGGLDFLKTNSVRYLSKGPFATSNNDQQKRTQALPPNYGASFGPSKPINPEFFRKFPQSVVTVNSKKFIVVQNPGVANKKESRFGENPEVLGLVFKYLTVKDLLNASRVNNCWKTTASSSSLWKVVRLKNSRIYDIESFVEFIRARETESIDFRKLLGSVDWNELFSRLSDVESLQTIILGSRSGQVFELAQEHCPHIEVTSGP